MEYIKYLIDPKIRTEYYLIAGGIAVILLVLGICFVKKKKVGRKKMVATVLLFTFLFIVFSSTVLSRDLKEYHEYELLPFWSYFYVNKELAYVELYRIDVFWFNILNIVMLMPIGVLLPEILQKNKRETLIWSTVIGFLVSCSIEILQLIFKRGLFEFDDIFHNTLGVFLSCSLYFYIKKKFQEKQKEWKP